MSEPTASGDDSVEMQNIRAWWAAMDWETRRACLMRYNPASCPCGDGTMKGHPYAWCMPPVGWLRTGGRPVPQPH